MEKAKVKAGAMAKVMAMLFAVLFAVLLVPVFSGSAATAWTGPDTLAIVLCGDVVSNGDTLEVDADCEDQFIETQWDRDHAERDRDEAEWDWDHAGHDDPGISAEEDAESRISAEAGVAKDNANETGGAFQPGWMGVLAPIAGIAIALIVIIAYRSGKAARRG